MELVTSIAALRGVEVSITIHLADTIASNRRILQDVQYHVKRLEYDLSASNGGDDQHEDKFYSDFQKELDEQFEEDTREAM